MVSSRSSTSTAPFSIATPARPAAAAPATVRGPMVGMSMRISWRGFGPFARTPRGPRARCGPAGAPPARAKRRCPPHPRSPGRPPATATAWPVSTAPRAARTAKPSMASSRSGSLRPTAPRGPEPASRSGATSCTPRTLKPLPSKKRTTRVSTESSPPASRRMISGMLRKKPASGRMRHRLGRVTAPAITSSRAPSPCRVATMRPIWPQLTQVCGKRAISASASPSMPTMCTVPAAARHALGDLQRQPASARQDADGQAMTAALLRQASREEPTAAFSHRRAARTASACRRRG